MDVPRQKIYKTVLNCTYSGMQQFTKHVLKRVFVATTDCFGKEDWNAWMLVKEELDTESKLDIDRGPEPWMCEIQGVTSPFQEVVGSWGISLSSHVPRDIVLGARRVIKSQVAVNQH